MPNSPLLFKGCDWNFDLLQRVYEEIETVAVEELELDVYPNQIEVITSEQMLDAYASVGMPLMYAHWSFGKRFSREEMLYRKGAQALAYELVINSDPCVSYVMEENTATMQTLVIAHAAFGHNHFFKNNHLFQQWTRADRVLDELAYGKRYIADCEQRYGMREVESVLDAAHALMSHGIDRYAPQHAVHANEMADRQRARNQHQESTYNDLWRTLPGSSRETAPLESDASAEVTLRLPEENLLSFLAEHSPRLPEWKREILRIVQRLSQYFFPQQQTKLMNEGCATFVHYEIMNRLHDLGRIDDAAMLEFLHMHAAVLTQPDFSDRRFQGLNPYALGFAMMRDIQRICEDPTEEDLAWFPDFAGNERAMETLRDAWSEYRDESFILQFLSPRLIREMRLFAVHDDTSAPFWSVEAIHDEVGYREIRRRLSEQYDHSRRVPEIEVTDADLHGNRRLVLTHRVREGRTLDKQDCNRTLRYVAQLWGYRVRLKELDDESGATLSEYDVVALP